MEINFVFLFKKYKLFIACLVVAATLTSALIIFNTSDFYNAKAKIYSDDSKVLKAAYEILKGEEVARLVADKFYSKSVNDAIASRKIIHDYSIPVLEIIVRSEDAALAATIANSLAEVLLRQEFSTMLYSTSSRRAQYEVRRNLAYDEIRPIDPKALSLARSFVALGFNTLSGEDFEKIISDSSIERRYSVILDMVAPDAEMRVKLGNEVENFFIKHGYAPRQVEPYLKAALYDELLERARLDEANMTLNLSIIEKAVPPEKPSGPDRIPIAATTFILSLAVAFTLVGVKERLWHRTKNRSLF